MGELTATSIESSTHLAADPDPPSQETRAELSRELSNSNTTAESNDGARPPRVIALMNQKGGVGKTTTTVNLGAALAAGGQRVLLVDLDPQAHLTLHLGLEAAQIESSIYDLMVNDDVPVEQVITRINDGLAVLPAHVNLAGIEAELAPKMITGRAQRILQEKCRELSRKSEGNDSPSVAHHDTETADRQALDLRPSTFDYILIDCPPSLGLLTVNALTFATEVIVPMQAQFLALQGLSQLLETVKLIQASFNPGLIVSGVVLCMHERQTILASEVMADLQAFLDAARDQAVPWRNAQILAPMIRRNIKLAECPSFGATVFDYAPQSHGAADYRALAASVTTMA